MTASKSRDESIQHKKFIDKARELGTDEDEVEFDKKLKRIVKPKLSKHAESKAQNKG